MFKKKEKKKFESKVCLVSEHQLVLNTIVLLICHIKYEYLQSEWCVCMSADVFLSGRQSQMPTWRLMRKAFAVVFKGIFLAAALFGVYCHTCSMSIQMKPIGCVIIKKKKTIRLEDFTLEI